MKSKFYYDDLKLLEKLNIPFKKSLNSPLREDKHRSFSIFEANGYIRWKDFGTGESGTIPQLYEKITNNKIIINKKYNYKVELDVDKHISINQKEFSNEDLKFWEQYFIDKNILDTFKVKSLESFKYNNKVYVNKKYMFSIRYFDGIYKIYMPESIPKFFHNCNSSHIFGQYQINKDDKKIIITKSFKDVMVLHLLGYNAVSIMSETINPISVSYFVNYCIDCSFTLYLLLDNDITGIKNAIKWKELYPFIKILLLDKYKDISDYIKNEGYEYTKKYIKHFL